MVSILFGNARLSQWLKQRSVWMLLLAGLSAIAFAACSLSPSATQSTTLPKEVHIGYQNVPGSLLLVKSLKLAEERFPDTFIKWIQIDAGWQVNRAMLEGDADIGLVGSVPVSTGIAQGLPLKVYTIHNVIGSNEALVVSEPSGIQTIEDLAGKNISVPFGSTAHFSLVSALQAAEIEPSDVNIRDMSPSAMGAAWRAKTIDGTFIWEPVLSRLQNEKGKVVVTAGSLVEKGALTADLGVVTEEFVAEYPGFVTEFMSVLEEATQLYREDPAMAAGAIAQETSLTPERSRTIIDELIWLNNEQLRSAEYLGSDESPGALADVLKRSADFMHSLDAIPPAPEVSTYQAALYHAPINE